MVRPGSLGRSGLKVSNLCLGCYNFGWRTDGAEAVDLVHRALDGGINFLDTADYYSGGESEAIVGRAVKGRRERVVIGTKVGEAVGDGPNDRGASRFRIMRQVEGSLRRLQTDYIDLYWVHRPDPDTPLEETLLAMDDLVRAGKVRCVGLSNFAAWQVMEALGVAERLARQGLAAGHDHRPPHGGPTGGQPAVGGPHPAAGASGPGGRGSGMNPISLGRAGVKVSPLCLGSLNFGWRTGEEEGIRIIHQALDAGLGAGHAA